MNESHQATVASIREAIDDADAILLKALAARFRAVKCLAMLKSASGRAVEDTGREKELKAKWKQQAKKLNVTEELALLMLDFILAESKKVQGPPDA